MLAEDRLLYDDGGWARASAMYCQIKLGDEEQRMGDVGVEGMLSERGIQLAAVGVGFQGPNWWGRGRPGLGRLSETAQGATDASRTPLSRDVCIVLIYSSNSEASHQLPSTAAIQPCIEGTARNSVSPSKTDPGLHRETTTPKRQRQLSGSGTCENVRDTRG